jgi:prevent-host-death family protein
VVARFNPDNLSVQALGHHLNTGIWHAMKTIKIRDTTMTTTTISKFRREFDAFQKDARSEPVEITRRGRRVFVLMSAEHYDWIRAARRRAHRISNMRTVVINSVKLAEMDRQHAALDELLK